MFREEGAELIGAGEVGRDDGEESPCSLAGLGRVRFIANGLFHELAVNFIAEGDVLVAMLWKKIVYFSKMEIGTY